MNKNGERTVVVFIDGVETSVAVDACVADACAVAHKAFPEPFARKEIKTTAFDVFFAVAVEGRDGFVNAFETPVFEGMRIVTHTPALDALKSDAVRALFAKHPADCMTCERSGDCFLQKLYFLYGNKECGGLRRTVKPALTPLGPFVKYDENRCVGCGRCVAFLNDVTGTADLELKNGRVVLKSEKGLTSEFSGNLTDLCPAGAMISATAKEVFRPWNVTKGSGVDITDTVCAPIALDVADGRVVRIVPAGCDAWITDKSRFSFDSLAVNRLDKPYVRHGDELRPCSWEYVALVIAEKIKKTDPKRLGALIGQSSDCESMLALQDWFNSLGSTAIDLADRQFYAEPSVPASWLFNTMLDRIADADALLMIGCDVRSDAPAVNARLRRNPMPKALLGTPVDLTYPYMYLGNTASLLTDIEQGTQAFCRVLEQAKHPMLIVGEDAFARPDGAAVMGACCRIADKYHMVTDDWNGYNFVAHQSATMGALALNLIGKQPLTPSFENGQFDFVYLLNAEYPVVKTPDTFVVYQGIFAGDTVACADVVLPALASTEKHATYVTLEGRIRRTSPLIASPGSAREDWKIFRFLSEYTGQAVLPYDDLATLRDHLEGENVIFYNKGEACFADWKSFGSQEAIDNTPFSLNDIERLSDASYSPTMRNRKETP